MNHKNLKTVLLLCAGLLLCPLIFAQNEVSAAVQDKQESSSGSQETEYSDDNYRRFMELKDQPGRTSTLPTNSYQSGTEKLDELPEESQKHLRNQLREIILESDEWSPGDERDEYPFVASDAGEKSPALKQKEAEAWGELVGKYHEREARIYANAARSNAAAGTKGRAPDTAQAQAGDGQSEGKQGSVSAETGPGTEQKQPGQQGTSADNQAASNTSQGSDSASSSSSAGEPNAVSTAGVSQSALEYLLGNNSETGSRNQASGGSGARDSASAQQQQATGSDPGQVGSPAQQSPAQQSPAQRSTAQQSTLEQSSDQQAMAQQQASATQSDQQAMAQQQASAAESDQAESERLSQQQDSSDFMVISKRTLSIKELQNAQGISFSTGSNSLPIVPVVTEEDQQRKDDDG